MKGIRNGFRQKMGAERAMLMLPFNVCMVARIRGRVDPEKLSEVLNQLRQRHALLASRVVFEENGEAWLETKDVPDFELKVMPRLDKNQWTERVEMEEKISFDMETGPLTRFILFHSDNVSELIICAHHIICDGMSLTYLIRDILQHLGHPERAMDILPDPPLFNTCNVPSPPSIKPIARKVMNLINNKWKKKNISFNNKDMEKLHKVFWKKNNKARLLAWTASNELTKTLVSSCREEKVTLNSVLWTAFLAAQQESQAPLKPYHGKAGMAVSIRDKLLLPVGESFGFFAVSFDTQLKFNIHKRFWENARIVHKQIKGDLVKADLFRSLKAELLHPRLLDSFYFVKYGQIKSGLSRMFLKQMKWDRISYGYAITNVGKMDIPTNYAALDLEAIYGPMVYSDVDEKLVGVITIGDTMTFSMTYNEDNIGVGTAEQIRDETMKYLSNAVGLV